jgi:putative endonuclease
VGIHHDHRHRGALYVGVTPSLAQPVSQHREGTSSDYSARRGLTRLVWADRTTPISLCTEHEKPLKRWRREWKFALIETFNPELEDLYDLLNWPHASRCTAPDQPGRRSQGTSSPDYSAGGTFRPV